MNTCLCGNLVDKPGASCPQCAARLALGLEMNAPESEIRGAYRQLVKVWHPEYFQNDAKLKEAAEAKLKEINSAFEFLTSTSTEREPWRPPTRGSAETTAQGQTGQSGRAQTGSAEAATGNPAPEAIPEWIPPFRFRAAVRVLAKVAMVGIVLLMGRYLWVAFGLHGSPSDKVTQAYIYGKSNVLTKLETPKSRILDAMKEDLQRLGLRRSAPEALEPAPLNAESGKLEKTPATTHEIQAAPRVIRPLVTVGSTRDEVIAQQGTPTAFSKDKLVYGRSELYFKDGSVVGWRIDPDSSSIRVKLWPASEIKPRPTFFAVGSSKDVVLLLQGTPSALSEDKFEYGRSEVYFRNDRVVSWKEDSTSTPLWVK